MESGNCDECGMKLKPKTLPIIFRNSFGKIVNPPEDYVYKYNNQKIKCDKCGKINIR